MPEILALAKQYYPSVSSDSLKSQLSQQGQYQALSLIIYAEDQATLDALYRALTQHPDVHMVL